MVLLLLLVMVVGGGGAAQVAFFDASNSGELTSRLTADTQEMSGDLTWVFRFTIEATVRSLAFAP